MHLIALIEDAEVIRRILEHLSRRALRQEGLGNGRSPPEGGPGAELPNPAQNILTYHPVPDNA